MRFGMLLRSALWLTVVALLSACAATEEEQVKASNKAGAEMLKPLEAGPPPVYRFYPGDQLSIAAVNRMIAAAVRGVQARERAGG